MPDQAEITTHEIRVQLRNLLCIALTKRKVSLGGKQVAEKEDLASAIRIVELILRTYELESPPLATLLAIVSEAPDYIAHAWLEVNRYILAPKSMRHRARTTPEANT
jgi:hypothetical protein